MEDKNNSIENKEPNFMDGFKYEIGDMYTLLRKHAINLGSASDAPNDLEIKNKLQEFLESGNKKESVNIGSVNLIFKKLIEQNCIIGKETIKYLCGLCSENQKDDKNNLISENDLIPILLKAEYEHYDKENNNQGKPKIRKCILTNDLFEEIINKIEKEEINRDNIKHIFELVGNIVGGLFSTKNQIGEKKILDIIKQFGKENTLDVLCDFFVKGDLSVISAKITFAFAGYHNLVEMILLTKLIGYGKFFANIAKEGTQSATIDLIGLVNDIKTVYENLISNQLDKVKEKDKLEWYNLHRNFVFSILNGILLNVTDKAPKEEKQEEKQKFVTSLSNKMEELFVGKREHNNEQVNIINEKVGENNDNKEINIINNEIGENDDSDFIGAMLEKIYNAVENVLTIDDEKIKELTVNKSADGDLEFVEVIKKGNVFSNMLSSLFGASKQTEQRDPHKFKITNFLKAIWNKLEDREKSHLKVLVLPIVFKMFGKKTWKKDILLHGLKIFGLENFDQIDNKNLDSIFNSVINIIDNLPNEQDNDDSKKSKISEISTNLKKIINVLFQANKNENLDQIKDSVDSLIDILFSLPKNFKGKDGKIDFTQIIKFLGDISKYESKWDALCKVIKPFLSDKDFLEKLVSGMFGQEINEKEAWKKDILISGLKLFAGQFDELSKDIKEILPNLISLYGNFEDKNGKIDFTQIKKFLDDINKDESKLKVLNKLIKLFCSDENFLTNMVDGIFGKDSWKANVLKHGLKFFGIRFDNLKAEDLKSILESVTKIIDNLPDRKETDEQKKQKISAITEATKTVFIILLVGKNKNENFDGLVQNLIDILLNDDLSQVEIIDNVEKILATVKNNFVDENNVPVFKDFIKSFLNNGDFLIEIVNNVEELKPLTENGDFKSKNLIYDNREKNWFVPVFENLSKLLINNIDNIGNSNDLCDCIGKILDTYKNFTKAIDIPVSAETCKTAFFDNSSSILTKINAVGSVKQRYDALNNFINGKNKFVKDKDEDKDDFKQVEKKYNAFIQEFNNSDIILTEDEQKIFDKFRFTFEINQIAAVESVQEILKTINAVFDNTTENNRDKNLPIVKDLFKSIIKDGRILKFITNSDELKPIRSILGDAFEKLAALIEIKIDAIENSDSIDSFIANDMSVLLDSYKKFAAALDKDSKNNPNYQGDIIESIKGMINCVQDNFLIKDNPQSQNAYANLLKVFFTDIKSESSNSFIDSVRNSISSISNFLIGESDDTDETNILTFVIDKIDNKSMNKNSKTALKKSLLCLMPLIRNSVDKNDFINKLNSLFDSYKELAKEIDKPFDFKVAKEFVNSQENQSKYNYQINQKNLLTAFINLKEELNKDVPSIKNIMHQYKLFRNEIEKIAKTGNKNFNLTEDQKNIFEGFELDQSKAISAIKNILISISNFCPSDKKIKNENNIMNENDIDNKNNISVNNNVINVNIHDQGNELNNDNEKPFNKVLINLLQGGNFLKDIINEIDSDDDADMSDDLKKYLANLSSPLCGFLISYLEQTKDIPQEISTKFNFILSKYLEITDIIKAEKVKIVELLDSVEGLLIYLNGDIVNKNDDVFNSYKNLWAEIFKSGQLINVFVDEVKKNFTNEQSNKYEKYLNFVTQAMPAFAYVISKISQSTRDHNFFSSWISKFKSLYLIFNNKKLLKEENNYDLNETIISQNLSENKLFNCLIDMLEFDRTDDDDMFLRQTTNDGNIISTNQEQSNLPINDNADGNKKIYLSETLFSDCWTITKYILKKYFKALKSYIQGAQNDDEILKILNDKINLQDPLCEYITFLSMTNFLFLRESKWYYLAVVGEIILSCTIGLPFVIPSGVYSIGNWIYRQINAPKNRSESEISQILSTTKLDESKLYVNVNSGHQNISMDTNKKNRIQ